MRGYANSQHQTQEFPRKQTAGYMLKPEGIVAISCWMAALFLFSFCRQEKMFEGKISYKHSFASCSPNYDEGFLRMTIGSSSDYYYKNGNYKWVIKESVFSEDVYLKDENRNYFLVGGRDVYYGEGSEKSEDILGYSIKKNRLKILGYSCNMLYLSARQKKDNSIVDRYIFYSPEIKIDTNAFSKLEYLSHNFISSKIHSLPLKIIMHNPDFEVIWEATDIEFITLNDSIFNITGKEEAKPVNRLSF